MDGVLVNDRGLVVTFSSVENARKFALAERLDLAPETPSILDSSFIKREKLTPSNLNCSAILNAWNFFADVAGSQCQAWLTFLAKDKRPNELYDKVFWGNNLPAVTPPVWSVTEIADLEDLLTCGFDILSRNLESEVSL